MNALVDIAKQLFGADPGPDLALVIATVVSKDAHAHALETKRAAATELKPILERDLAQAQGLDDTKAEKTIRAKLVEVDQRCRELPPAIRVAREADRVARQALAEVLVVESEKASVGLARTVEQAVTVLRDAVFEWVGGRRRHVTILGSVGQAALGGSRPPEARGYVVPRGDLVGRLLSVLLDRDGGWV